MRKSNDKIIVDEVKYRQLYRPYIDILDRLMAAYPVKAAKKYEDLVNFKSNKTEPKHGWYDYKQGYAEKLVKNIILEEKVPSEDYILDPFCGVGTTNLTAQSLGYRSIGFDINPMAVLASNIKTHHFTDSELSEIKETIGSFQLPKKEDTIEDSKVVLSSFTPDVLCTLLRIKYFIEKIKEPFVQGFFRLALISIIDDCSLKVKDGNGLKIRKNYKPIENLVGHYINKCQSMYNDILAGNYSADAHIIFGSMLNCENLEVFSGKPVKLSIFSPPYANCFDYCEVYKLEFWIGGFVKKYEDFERYRALALRSHVNSKFSHEFQERNIDVDTIAEIVSTFNIWNKNIPDMLRGYFDDMCILLKNMYSVLEDGGKVYIVVANSAYKGILVPTDLLLADIGHKIGYTVDNIFVARKIRSSSQQMQVLNDSYNNLMRESIIVLSK